MLAVRLMHIAIPDECSYKSHIIRFVFAYSNYLINKCSLY